MANWKEIKRKIKSIKNTAKITKAMELISTVKMKKAQDEANSKKDFILSLLNSLSKMWATLDDFPLFEKRENWKTLWVIITSNKWLCWGYNVNTFKSVNSYISKTKEDLDFITCWKRGAQFVAKSGYEIISDFSWEFSDNVTFDFSKNISKLILQEYKAGKYKKVVVFYNYFVNTIKQISVEREFIPFIKEDIEEYLKKILWEEDFKTKFQNTTKDPNYIFEPWVETILEELMPLLVDMMFYDMLLEAKASEHSSRMIAMKNAKDNANKFAWKLTLEYNKARQASITKEVSEIVSWVESMKDT